jgi:crotonobetainyl-CoA:carnitine CoA-transferase CaiB-like acyl-CoA transferase
MQLPLEDVKILDLSHALAGPFCSTMRGDFGAQVVKVEVPGTGDIARAWGPPFYHTEAAYFVSLHRNKQSIEIDLKTAAGKELFFRLVERFDVVPAGEVQVVGVPVKLSETPGSVRAPAPLLGQHTDAVLREYLGMGEADLVALRQVGAIGPKR